MKFSGHQQFSNKQYVEAIKTYSDGINFDPTNQTLVSLFLYKRGLANLNSRKYDEAIEDFSKVLNFNPSHQDALIHRAELYFRSNNFKASITDYNCLLQSNDDEKIQQKLAIVYKEFMEARPFEYNCYILNLDKDTNPTYKEARKSYFTLCKIYHPDRSGDDETRKNGNSEQFKRLNNAHLYFKKNFDN